jgi:hypothetical protein
VCVFPSPPGTALLDIPHHGRSSVPFVLKLLLTNRSWKRILWILSFIFDFKPPAAITSTVDQIFDHAE